MGILEQLIDMKNHGINDEEIIKKLNEQGFSPKAINDAISQSQIKNAVAAPEETSEYQGYEQTEGGYFPQTKEMPEEGYYTPRPEKIYQPMQQPMQDTYAYPQNVYPASSTEAGGAFATDSDTIIEIAEQVFSEKIKKNQEKLDNIEEFKTLAETKIENISERLRRVEMMIDKLQVLILEKISSYGKEVESTKKEISMLEDSFGKMIPSIAERVEKEKTGKKTSKKK